MRSPFQILVLPYIQLVDSIEYCIFKREPLTGGYWQGIAGGGEDNETPLEAALRETYEETQIPISRLKPLETYTMIPTEMIFGKLIWGKDKLVIPEYCFGLELSNKEEIKLSSEHSSFIWCDYDKAFEKLHWDSNKRALFELNYRIKHDLWA